MAPAEPALPSGHGLPATPCDDIPVELVYCPAPRQVRQCRLRLPRGATVADALAASGWEDGLTLSPTQAQQAEGGRVGIWGRRVDLTTPLQAHDRIEIYRALTVDPKEARRQRYRAHGEKLPKGIHRPRAGPR